MRSTPTQRSGSETSPTPDTSRRESWTSGTFGISGPKMSPGQVRDTFSPGSRAGRSPSGWQEFQMKRAYGVEVVPVNQCPTREREEDSTTTGTSGPPFSLSSESADLSSSLGNRLRALLATSGSTLFTLTWKKQATPSGRPFFLLRASARRTAGTESSSGRLGWPTTKANDGKGVDLSRSENRSGKRHSGDNLPTVAAQAGWPTPDAGNFNETDASWEERRAALAEKHGNNGFGLTLGQAASLASWATPQARDVKGSDLNGPHDRGTKGPPLNEQVRLTILGETPTGSTVGTEPQGQLSPVHSSWLMGYPLEWLSCAPEAPSRRGRGSSKDSGTR